MPAVWQRPEPAGRTYPPTMVEVEDGRRRVVIENVRPEIDAGRFPAKGSIGEPVVVEADIFGDGHDLLTAVVLWRGLGGTESPWRETPMALVVNDRWRGQFEPRRPGTYEFAVQAWVDHFKSWEHELERRDRADAAAELVEGARMVEAAARRAAGSDAHRLHRFATALRGRNGLRAARSEALARLMEKYSDRGLAACSPRAPRVVVERERARFSAWYELFPRSTSPDPKRAGTLRDVEAWLPYVAGMGFHILYLPPIHPIGRSFRKGRNNTVSGTASDVGSPWAIGSEAGGHKSVSPDLGSLDDFRRLVRATRRHGLETALDIAFQCSPDHPYVREHPDWFRQRPDGSIRHAENPPKKYQDIYPFNFETEDWRGLWDELLSIFLFWAEQGVLAFRVDNPHTKPFAFWEWVLARVREQYPDAIFLSEAFTRPKVMYQLAKAGFSLSYTYFAWRTEPEEIKAYATELTTPPVADFFRPSYWPNTPDILTEQLQAGGVAMSALRFVLAATLGASYGIYGPAFEQVDTRPLIPGKEEYMDSEKYQVRHWDLQRPGGLRELVTRVNAIRRDQPALRHDRTLRFLRTDNQQLLAYTKTAPDGSAPVCVIVNLDAARRQAGWVELPAAAEAEYEVVDLLNGPIYRWRGAGSWNFVDLDPAVTPAHVLRVGARLRPAEA
jgi:starch synthase (maltosyl-transferring)